MSGIGNFFNNLNNSIPADTAFFLAFMSFYVISFLFVLIGIIFNHILTAIPIYIMAHKAGYAYPFIAFIPFAKEYLMHVLPSKEYSFIGLYKTYDRKIGFWIFFTTKYVAQFVATIILGVIAFIPLLGSLVSLVSPFIVMVITACAGISTAIMAIDLFELYWNSKDKSIPVIMGILNVFFPIVLPIMLYILCSREPEYGFGNYYYPIYPSEEEE
ncbi:MAG: hypothetical protein K6G75_11095 [Lachnospiraceae bacterium]|nr:hypothetical protein [Lachnospiraceae bacterium]